MGIVGVDFLGVIKLFYLGHSTEKNKSEKMDECTTVTTGSGVMVGILIMYGSQYSK